MRKVSLIGNSLAYLLCQTRQRATDYRSGMTPEDVRAVSNSMPDIRDIGTTPERPVTNSLAYLLCQTRQRATDYRPGMTPEGVRAVSEKSVQHETTRGRNAPFDGRRTQVAAPGAVTVPHAWPRSTVASEACGQRRVRNLGAIPKWRAKHADSAGFAT
jgi:hypothetical protein